MAFIWNMLKIKMPATLATQAMKILPDWMLDVSERFHEYVNTKSKS